MLVLATDSTIVGKRNLLCCYQKARNSGLKGKNIRSGWNASGLWPVNIAKPLLSPLLLKKADIPQEQPSGNGTSISQASQTPISTPQPLFTGSVNSIVEWSTPKKSKDLWNHIY